MLFEPIVEQEKITCEHKESSIDSSFKSESENSSSLGENRKNDLREMIEKFGSRWVQKIKKHSNNTNL